MQIRLHYIVKYLSFFVLNFFASKHFYLIIIVKLKQSVSGPKIKILKIIMQISVSRKRV